MTSLLLDHICKNSTSKWQYSIGTLKTLVFLLESSQLCFEPDMFLAGFDPYQYYSDTSGLIGNGSDFDKFGPTNFFFKKCMTSLQIIHVKCIKSPKFLLPINMLFGRFCCCCYFILFFKFWPFALSFKERQPSVKLG